MLQGKAAEGMSIESRSSGDTPARRMAVRPRTVWLVAGAIVLLGAVALGLIWLSLRPEGAVELDPAPRETTSVVSFAGGFPETDAEALANPRGIAWDGERLYVAEADAGRVRAFSPEGARLGEIRVPVAPGAVTAYPIDVAPAGDGSIAVVDTAGSRAMLLPVPGARGRERVLAGPRGPLLQPTAVVFGAGELFVADSGAGSIEVFDASGRHLRSIAASLTPRLSAVNGLCLADGRLYVADAPTGRVLALDPRTGEQAGILDERFNLPRGVAADDSGHLLVVDVFARSLVLLTKDGTVVDTVGEAGKEPGGGELAEALVRPQGVVWVSRGDRAYVTDSASGRIQVFNLSFGRQNGP